MCVHVFSCARIILSALNAYSRNKIPVHHAYFSLECVHTLFRALDAGRVFWRRRGARNKSARSLRPFSSAYLVRFAFIHNTHKYPRRGTLTQNFNTYTHRTRRHTTHTTFTHSCCRIRALFEVANYPGNRVRAYESRYVHTGTHGLPVQWHVKVPV